MTSDSMGSMPQCGYQQRVNEIFCLYVLDCASAETTVLNCVRARLRS